MDKRYNNYHRHSHYSNLRTLDCISKPIDYINRAKELGHTTYFTTEHGWQGNIFEALTLCQENNLKCIYGVEAYYVDDRFNKEDRRNYHIILIALTNNARKEINSIISKANTEGFYYKPRIDRELLLTLTPNETIITTACVAGRLFKDGYEEEFLNPIHNHFKDNLYLEVQSHNHPSQINYNKLIVALSRKYNIKMIHANDSHYIKPEDSKYRDLFLKAKGIIYEEEDGFILDYPSYDEIVERYRKQRVLTESQIQEVLQNTLIFDKAEDIDIDKEFKIPKIVKGDSNEILKDILDRAWQKEKANIKPEKHKIYEQAIEDEFNTIKECGMADYFILDHKIVDKAVNEYDAVLTRSGRGCFTKDALVHTKVSLKPISDVEIGDEVIDINGDFKKVINTMSYDIDEELIQIKHIFGTDKYYPTVCTKDHKIFIHRNNENQWIEAQDLKKGDFVCVPKTNVIENSVEYIDLNNYNIFGFEFDDEYIYEYNPYISNYYKFSPSDIARNIGVGKSLVEKLANGIIDNFKRKPDKFKEFMEYIPFNSVEEYREYIKNKRTLKIRRFIKNDYMLNQFIGLLYGDGFKAEQKITVGLAINTENHKSIINKKIFYSIAERIGLEVYSNKSKSKKLEQISISSKILNEYISKEIFISKKGKDKQFNPKFFNETIKNQKGILNGLFLSDGSNKDNNRENFDNTSLSLINAYKVLSLNTRHGINSLSVREKHIDINGYINKESYKLRRSNNIFNSIKISERCIEDDKYWYLPLKEIIFLPKQKTKVYDLTIEDSHSYLINNMIVHNSAVSFYVTKLLGLTEVDRIKAPITLYPSRFLTSARVLETRSLPDIDLNFAEVTPVIKASKDILGEDGIYYMIAYKPLQESSAFRLWCKSQDMEIDDYNEIAKNLDNYIEDKKWKDIIEDSKVFRGVIESVAPSPCSFLLSNNPISSDVGLIKVGNEICCCLDGYNCDVYKYLKNDYLTVQVYSIISEVYKLIGRPIDNISTLINNCDDKVWDIYEKGLTTTINQADSDFGKQTIMRFKPRSLADLSGWVASIRPGFASLMNDYLDRKPYTTGVKELDNLLEESSHRMLYQESIMKYLIWLGIDEKDSYDVIKKIAKKKFKEEELQQLKIKLIDGWKIHVGRKEGFEETWQVIESAVRYSFNASHSVSVAIDSLYGAYLKSHYPLEYFTVALNQYSNDANRTNNLIDELSYFDIKIKSPIFRYSKGDYFLDKETQTIYRGIGSIKYLNSQIGDELYELKSSTYSSFLDLLIDIKTKINCNTKQLDLLIKIDFFKEFGSVKKLLHIVGLHNKFYNKKTLSKDKLEELGLTLNQVLQYGTETKKQIKDLDSKKLLKDLVKNIEDEEFSVLELIQMQKEILGYIDYINPELDKSICLVNTLDTKYATKRVNLYCLNNGKTVDFKINKRLFENNPLKEGDIIHMTSQKKFKPIILGEKENGKPIWGEDKTCLEWHLVNYNKINLKEL